MLMEGRCNVLTRIGQFYYTTDIYIIDLYLDILKKYYKGQELKIYLDIYKKIS